MLWVPTKKSYMKHFYLNSDNISIDMDGVEYLLNLYQKNKNEELLQLIEAVKEKRKNDNTLYLIIPQYQSSICFDDCKYCGFRKSNKSVPRKYLSDSEFKEEFNLILDWGYRVVEFVYSTDLNQNSNTISKRLIVASEIAKSRNIEIKLGLNAFSFPHSNDYKLLKENGLDFFVQWMETYNKMTYQKWHKSSSIKFDFDLRLSTYNRAIEGGIENYGLGVLLGINDWREDVYDILKHAFTLKNEYGKAPHIFGIPRVKYNVRQNTVNTKYLVNDKDFIFIANLYRFFFPSTKLFLNTREDILLNEELLTVGGDIFTIDCGTFPGFYIHPNSLIDNIGQFKTFQYNKDSVLNIVKQNNLKICNYW